MHKYLAAFAATVILAVPAAAQAKQHSPVRTNPLGWVRAWELANDAPFYDAQTHAPKSGPLAWVGAWEHANPGQAFYTR